MVWGLFSAAGVCLLYSYSIWQSECKSLSDPSLTTCIHHLFITQSTRNFHPWQCLLICLLSPVKQFLKAENIEIIKWPDLSPDLNLSLESFPTKLWPNKQTKKKLLKATNCRGEWRRLDWNHIKAVWDLWRSVAADVLKSFRARN